MAQIPLPQLLVPRAPVVFNKYAEFTGRRPALKCVYNAFWYALANHPGGVEFPKLIELEFSVEDLLGGVLDLTP
jgi:hypothetical protein